MEDGGAGKASEAVKLCWVVGTGGGEGNEDEGGRTGAIGSPFSAIKSENSGGGRGTAIVGSFFGSSSWPFTVELDKVDVVDGGLFNP